MCAFAESSNHETPASVALTHERNSYDRTPQRQHARMASSSFRGSNPTRRGPPRRPRASPATSFNNSSKVCRRPNARARLATTARSPGVISPKLRNAVPVTSNSSLLIGATPPTRSPPSSCVVKQLGCELYACGQADEHGDSATAQERLSSLRMGQSLVQPGSSLLLFDELEDLFKWDPLAARSRPEMSKQWFNLLLERNPVPTVWISGRHCPHLVCGVASIAQSVEAAETLHQLVQRSLDLGGSLPFDHLHVGAATPTTVGTACTPAEAIRATRIFDEHLMSTVNAPPCAAIASKLGELRACSQLLHERRQAPHKGSRADGLSRAGQRTSAAKQPG